jgi:hypothetical protein
LGCSFSLVGTVIAIRSTTTFVEEVNQIVIRTISAGILLVLAAPLAFGQTPSAPEPAVNPVQESLPVATEPASPQTREITIPAGTAIDIQAMHDISSMDAKVGDLISFRVLVPVKVSDAIVIPENALVTAQIVKAKRAGHWGKAGKLLWTMRDVVAVDYSRVSLTANADFPRGEQGVTGQSHGAEVATRTAVMAGLLAPTVVLAPLALMQGFKRGEQAVLTEGKRFVVYVQKDTAVRVPSETKSGP